MEHITYCLLFLPRFHGRFVFFKFVTPVRVNFLIVIAFVRWCTSGLVSWTQHIYNIIVVNCVRKAERRKKWENWNKKKSCIRNRNPIIFIAIAVHCWSTSKKKKKKKNWGKNCKQLLITKWQYWEWTAHRKKKDEGIFSHFRYKCVPWSAKIAARKLQLSQSLSIYNSIS